MFVAEDRPKDVQTRGASFVVAAIHPFPRAALEKVERFVGVAQFAVALEV
jgi:hypothetical protein